jgi:mannitol-1-phosphate/altronate dehydrogenase
MNDETQCRPSVPPHSAFNIHTSSFPRTFVGFGFGPIQSALFLYEAYRSGHFSRFVIAEVDAALVQAVRSAGGRYSINIARPDRIEQATISGVELYDPAAPEDRQHILQAIAASDELATSLPSIAFYDRGGQTSVARALADGLSLRTAPRPTIIYTAENHNHAAELLREAVAQHCPPTALQHIQFLNTVIGKMSGVITDTATIAKLNLAPITPAIPKAVLVEEFNRILISQITLPGFARGIDVFIEKPDLLPFEEAKLYGHNAIHALIAFLAAQRDLTTMSDAASHPDIMAKARAAFLDESGAALIRKHAALGDPLFTRDGYAAYAEDLLARMVRPTLNDLIARVTRDQVRKLGYDDRFYGTMRLALQYGLRPIRVAQGAAAAVLSLLKQWDSLGQSVAPLPRPAGPLSRESLGQLLRAIWSTKAGPDAGALIDLTWEALTN